jgi:hypothetical protein
MKYVIEMGPVAILYVPSFIKTGSGIRKLIGEEGTQTQQYGDCSSLFYFIHNCIHILFVIRDVGYSTPFSSSHIDVSNFMCTVPVYKQFLLSFLACASFFRTYFL